MSRNRPLSTLYAAALLLPVIWSCCRACGQPAAAQCVTPEVKSERPFPFYRQRHKNDCGAACLRMICSYYGQDHTEKYFVKKLRPDKQGVSLLTLSELSDTLGFRALGAALSFGQLQQSPLPCIVHWKERHFIVVYKIDAGAVLVADPADTLRTYDTAAFKKGWYSSRFHSQGIVLLLEKK